MGAVGWWGGGAEGCGERFATVGARSAAGTLFVTGTEYPHAEFNNHNTHTHRVRCLCARVRASVCVCVF